LYITDNKLIILLKKKIIKLLFYHILLMDLTIIPDHCSSDSDSDTVNEGQQGRVNANTLLQIVQIVGETIVGKYSLRRSDPLRLTGGVYVEELLSEDTNIQRFLDVFRMPRRVFLQLVGWLKAKGFLRCTVTNRD